MIRMNLRECLEWFYGSHTDVADIAIQTFITVIVLVLCIGAILMLITSANARFLFGFFGGIVGAFWLFSKLVHWYINK